jgi:FkbM family methyltransferase
MAKKTKLMISPAFETGLKQSTQIRNLKSDDYSSNKSAKVRRAIATVRSQGIAFYAQSYMKKRLSKNFLRKKEDAKLNCDSWKEINFKALGLHGQAKLLLNHEDTGFSREFNVYGFREPLNTCAIFQSVEKWKPTVLDIGGNLGYFTLVELTAGAKKVISVEPVKSTFNLLTKNLENYKEAEPLNVAISDSKENLKLYVGKDRNITSSFKELFVNTGHSLDYEITAKTETLQSMAEKYPINMIRMDVEGHEYRILTERIPDQIDTINVELHVLPPFKKDSAVELLRCLAAQNFHAHAAINEMNYEYYDFVEKFGLKSGYMLASTFGSHLKVRPRMQVDPSFGEVVNSIPEKGQIHLMLER